MKIGLIGYDVEIIDIIDACGFEFAGYFDLEPSNDGRYLGNDADVSGTSFALALGMQSPNIRKRVRGVYGHRMSNLISPHSYISEHAVLKTAITVQHHCTIMPYARIEEGCQMNLGATVHHDSSVDRFVTLAPFSLVLGRVSIGEGAYIGARSIIKEGCSVGKNAVVGAGAVVVEDVLDGTTVVGVPARPIHE